MMSVLLGLLIPPVALLVILILSWFEDHVLVPPGGYASLSAEGREAQEALGEAELSGTPGAAEPVGGAPGAGLAPSPAEPGRTAEPEPQHGRTPDPMPRPLPIGLRGRPWRGHPASGARPGYRPPLLPDTGTGAQHPTIRALRR